VTESTDGDKRPLVELAVRALADTYADRGDGTASEEALRGMVERASRALKGRIDVPPDEIDALVEMAARRSYAAGFEYSRRQVARWFEVPPDEFDQTPVEELHSDILLRHMYYEQKLQDWFCEWGYAVQWAKSSRASREQTSSRTSMQS
jgi:hypothetical protein